MTTRTASLPSPAAPQMYRAAQALGLGLTVVLLAGLMLWPHDTLRVLWDMVIPLLPATFLVNPILWRNVCPLATINAIAGRRGHWPRLEGTMLRVGWAVGIALLVIMVPARRFLFNVNAPALAATIAGIAALAAVAGLAYAGRAGFCSSLCPVLPVEKLYGQAPLASFRTARCASCSVCIPAGCVELAREKAVAQTLGPARRGTSWLRTPLGAFAVAFPGFVIGYFSASDGSITTASSVYATVLGWSAASYVILGLMVYRAAVPARFAFPVLAGLAAGLYYWYVAPTLAVAYGGREAYGAFIRVAALALVAYWTWWALWGRRRIRVRPTAPGRAA